MKGFVFVVSLLLVAGLALGTWRKPNFWRTPDQRGDALSRKGKFAEAAKAYGDPWRKAVAQYRNGDFEAAAKTFARVPGPEGAFDQGNAWLMHGKYDEAIASYERALSYRVGWKEAMENKALASARKAKMQAAGKNAEEEQTGQDKPDEIVFDQKGQNTKGKPVELAKGDVSDQSLQATWLRRVQTTPGDFLKAKFAYQVATKGPTP